MLLNIAALTMKVIYRNDSKGIADPKRKIVLSLYSQTLWFWNHFRENQSMIILNWNDVSIHFLHGKMGRKISEGNAAMYPLQKSLIGIRILK